MERELSGAARRRRARGLGHFGRGVRAPDTLALQRDLVFSSSSSYRVEFPRVWSTMSTFPALRVMIYTRLSRINGCGQDLEAF